MMGNISADKKLELVQSIRMDQQNNRAVMSNRERIIYGKPSGIKGEIYGLEAAVVSEGMAVGETEVSPLRSFKIRLFLAVVIFCAFLFWDRTGGSFMGVDSNLVAEEITAENQDLHDLAAKLFDLF